jgi:biopolymer transport protein ExbD
MNDTKTPPIVISIDKESRIFIEEANISLEDLVQKLPSILENSKSDAIYIYKRRQGSAVRENNGNNGRNFLLGKL